jgi:hypothetical protein
MNEKVVKKTTTEAENEGLVFQFRNQTITPEMDGQDVVDAIYAAPPRSRYDVGSGSK